MRRNRITLLVDVVYWGITAALLALILYFFFLPEAAHTSWFTPAAIALTLAGVLAYEARKRTRP